MEGVGRAAAYAEMAYEGGMAELDGGMVMGGFDQKNPAHRRIAEATNTNAANALRVTRKRSSTSRRIGVYSASGWGL